MTHEPPVPAERERRSLLSYHEQMLDAQALCAPCKLCGGSAVITDAGEGAGYYICCGNARAFRPVDGCMIGDNRLGGWAYNVADWWNRLHLSTPPARPGREEVETGWLIEENAGGITHWIALSDGPQHWHKLADLEEHELFKADTPVRRVKDSNEALRFARKVDAEAFIVKFDVFLLHAVATDHQWISNTAVVGDVKRIVAAFEDDPFVDDLRMQGTTQQNARFEHYARVALGALFYGASA